MRSHSPVLLPVLLVLPACLAGCGYTPPRSSERLEELASCRSQANRVYAAQNRDQLSQRDTSSAPFSGNTLPVDPTRGLYSRYSYEQLQEDCLSGAGAPSSTGPEAAPAATPPQPTPAP